MLTKVLLPEAEHVPLDEEADAKLLIGDAALKSAFEDPTPHYDLGRLWLERTGLPMVFAVWACPEPVADGLAELEDALVASVRLARAEPEKLAFEASERYGYPAGFLARYFEKLRYSLRAARARRASTRSSSWPTTSASSSACPSSASSAGATPFRHDGRRDRAPCAEILEKALDGERISDDDAIALLRSRDLVAGRPRRRTSCATGRSTRDRITFIVDRNLNYTNICVTDCDFCAFYRSPGDRARATCCRSR